MDKDYTDEIVKEAKLGKKHAFKNLCEANFKKIYNLAYRMLLKHEDATKVTSETFLDAWDNLKHLRSDQKFDTWIKSIAIYKILDKARIGKGSKLFSKSHDNDIPDLDNVETKNIVELLIMSQPKMERIVYILHDIEEYSSQEISDFIDGLTIKQITTIVRKTRENLIEAIKYA
ncbi:MAG: sigma-70 family RNA polymerase sigma factor [Bacteroidota bacterium]